MRIDKPSEIFEFLYKLRKNRKNKFCYLTVKIGKFKKTEQM